jgi:hypothetical protein
MEPEHWAWSSYRNYALGERLVKLKSAAESFNEGAGRGVKA